jgi:hypothetical protein
MYSESQRIFALFASYKYVPVQTEGIFSATLVSGTSLRDRPFERSHGEIFHKHVQRVEHPGRYIFWVNQRRKLLPFDLGLEIKTIL